MATRVFRIYKYSFHVRADLMPAFSSRLHCIRYNESRGKSSIGEFQTQIEELEHHRCYQKQRMIAGGTRDQDPTSRTDGHRLSFVLPFHHPWLPFGGGGPKLMDTINFKVA